ncbi:MAG: fatty acid desaturase [Gammaproteobacteria bacterium]|nr:fatty acid desaturase [Gammaproteobacteria bacterium]
MAVLGFILGGHWLWLGFVFTLAATIAGDFLFGDEKETPKYGRPQILDVILYSYLPVMAGAAVVFVCTMASGDLFGIGAAVTAFTGYDPLTARMINTGIDYVGAALGFGVLLAIVNTLIAHELTHRTSDPVGLFMGRWFFAMSGGISFEVEQVYGHHHTVGQPYDASLSLRRHSYYDFFATAPIKQIVYAWDVEKKRLAKYGKSVFSIKNHMIQSALRITVVWTIIFLLGGWLAVAVYTLAFWTSKMLLEALGFMFHHGQVRDITQPYTTRHSWNSNKRCSSVVLCNVTRHSEHHDNPDRPFYELSVVKPGAAPMLKYGAITTAFTAFIPPLFFRFFGPQILKWD